MFWVKHLSLFVQIKQNFPKKIWRTRLVEKERIFHKIESGKKNVALEMVGSICDDDVYLL